LTAAIQEKDFEKQKNIVTAATGIPMYAISKKENGST
jgi:hypothetical protein